MNRVLVIDDQVEDTVLLHIAFEMVAPHVEVEVAHDGPEALQGLRPGALPDLVLLDTQLPRMSGLDILKALRAYEGMASARIVLMSSVPQEDVARAAVDLGAEAFVVKPGDLNSLLSFVERLLRGPDRP